MSEIHYGRKRKGIAIELKKKISEWLDSIKDPEVRLAAKNDVIVTGGSIASMLLGEKVNDYDVYFRTYETTLKVAKYYVNEFNKANDLTTDGNAREYKPVVKEETRENIKGESEKRVILWMQSAGVAAEEQGEYSYFESLPPAEAAEFMASTMMDMAKAEEEAKKKDPYRPVFMSENAITLSDKVQLVTRFYGEPTEIHSNYDFVHAMCYYDHKADKLEFSAEALEALLSRTLVYKGSLYPVASIFRAKKFIERGWRITAGQLLKIMWQISEIDLTKPSVLREQLTGVDMAYMWQLINALQDVDPEKINSVYVAELIDRIFE